MILISTKHYLIGKGIEAVLKDIPGNDNSLISYEVDKLLDLVLNYTPNIIIGDIDIYPKIEPYLQKHNDVRWIVLAEKTPIVSKYMNVSDVLLYNANEEQVRKILKQNIAMSTKVATNQNKTNVLSEREEIVLREVALGKTNKEIADNLCISAHTVITHRKNITRKLGIKTVSGLTVYAMLNNLIQIDEI